MTVLCGDCRIVLQSISDDSIDLVYMDPPFFHKKIMPLSNAIVLHRIHLKTPGTLSKHIFPL